MEAIEIFKVDLRHIPQSSSVKLQSFLLLLLEQISLPDTISVMFVTSTPGRGTNIMDTCDFSFHVLVKILHNSPQPLVLPMYMD